MVALFSVISFLGIPASAESNYAWVPEKLPNDANVVGWQIQEDMLPRLFRSKQWNNDEFSLVLPRCTNDESTWCIESVSIYPSGSSKLNATFIREISGGKIEGDASRNLPAGGSVSLWQSNDITANLSGKLFAASAQIVLTVKPDGRLILGDLEARIYPYSEYQGISPSTGKKYLAVDGNLEYGRGPYPECAWTEDNICGRIENFPQNVRASLTLRIPPEPVQTIAARVVNPQVKIKQAKNKQISFTLDALPIDLPKFYAFEKPDNLTRAMKSTFWAGIDKESGISTEFSGTMKSFSILNAWKDKVQDKSAALVSTWQFRTIPWDAEGRCQEGVKFYGVVSTNALVTDGSGFQFADRGFEYRVAGLHLNPDGSVFRGSYELSMRREFAECMFGLSSAPISAKIVIVENGQEQRIETTTYKESQNELGKFLDFSAQGFTFSSPTLRITLSQPKSMKKTVICVKGGVTKKISGINPKCPAGYKKK